MPARQVVVGDTFFSFCFSDFHSVLATCVIACSSVACNPFKSGLRFCGALLEPHTVIKKLKWLIEEQDEVFYMYCNKLLGFHVNRRVVAFHERTVYEGKSMPWPV